MAIQSSHPARVGRSCALVLLALALPLLAVAQHRGDDAQQRRPAAQQWQDSRHGHSRTYPVTGHIVGHLPGRATAVTRGRDRYWYADGVWYAPRRGGYVVSRPAYGLVLHGLPAFATVVTFGALSYYYANNVYYRPLPGNRYEVVTPPEPQPNPAVGMDKVFVYPRQGQSAELQASDEYECHRWASGQSGFDPISVATGQAAGSDALRQDYQRASAACLEGRGYTVR